MEETNLWQHKIINLTLYQTVLNFIYQEKENA